MQALFWMAVFMVIIQVPKDRPTPGAAGSISATSSLFAND